MKDGYRKFGGRNVRNVELIRCGVGIGQKGTIFGKIIGIRPD